MAYAILTEGMSLEARAAFDLTLNMEREPLPVEVREGRSVAAQNRDALRSWAALGVPVPAV